MAGKNTKSLWINKELHSNLRLICAQEDVKIKDLTEELIREGLKRRGQTVELVNTNVSSTS